MSVLVYVELENGMPKKASLEAVNFGAAIGEVTAFTIGKSSNDADGEMGKYGASKVVNVNDERLSDFHGRAVAKVTEQLAGNTNASWVVFAHSSRGKETAPRVAVRLNAGIVTAVNANNEGNKVSRSVFSGKGIAEYRIDSDIKVVTINPNSLNLEEKNLTAEKSDFAPELSDADFGVKVESVDKMSGDVAPLPEAELVVSGGRGLKGPENWGMLEDLAGAIGATMACSRPVADVGWRPHHEHVGQTGLAIKPNLYIAVGISGAIQHLAGVNSSKVIVVINKDPEAPFFKAADYGIVGDAFDVIPKLTEEIKKLKGIA